MLLVAAAIATRNLGIVTRSKDATSSKDVHGLTTSNKKLLVTKGIATRSKDATRNKNATSSCCHRY